MHLSKIPQTKQKEIFTGDNISNNGNNNCDNISIDTSILKNMNITEDDKIKDNTDKGNQKTEIFNQKEKINSNDKMDIE